MTRPGPYRDGRIYVLSRRCGDCVLRPGNLMHLQPGRLADLVKSNRDADSALTCHQTLPYGGYDDVKPAVCRGYFDAYAAEVTPLRLAVAIGIIAYTPPPTEGTRWTTSAPSAAPAAGPP